MHPGIHSMPMPRSKALHLSPGSPTIEPLPTVEEAAAAAIEPPPTATEEEAAIKAEPSEPLTVDSDFEDQYAKETAEELIMQRSAPLPPDFYLGMVRAATANTHMPMQSCDASVANH